MKATTENTSTDNNTRISLVRNSVRCSQKVISLAFPVSAPSSLFFDFIPVGL